MTTNLPRFLQRARVIETENETKPILFSVNLALTFGGLELSKISLTH